MKAFITVLTIALAVCVISGCDDEQPSEAAPSQTIAVENEAANALPPRDSLAERFDTPPAAARPWVRWWWLDLQSEESITRDLEALKAKGIGGMILYACDGSILPEDIFGQREMYRTPEWVERVNHAGVKKQSIN